LVGFPEADNRITHGFAFVPLYSPWVKVLAFSKPVHDNPRMPKRASKKPRLPDPAVMAFQIVQSIAEERPIEQPAEKNQAAVALGKLGGRKGGLARAANLSPRKRKEIARKAANARWQKKKED
jgi:hypothetical protein